METDKRLSRLSSLQETRSRLRGYLALETVLMERIAALPEDNEHRLVRESFQFGAAWAYLQRGTSDVHQEAIYDAFFATKLPRNHLGEQYVNWERQHIIAVAQLMLDGEDLDLHQLDMRVDTSVAQELVAFIEGFVITSDYFAAKDYTSPTPAAEPA